MTDQTPPPAPGFEPYGGAPAARPGELLERFGARLIDYILLAVVNGIIVSVIVVGAVMGANGGFYGASTWAASAVSALLTTAISLGYFVYLESSRGQTVGKMLLKLKTVGPTGANPTMEQALRRNVWMAAGFLGVLPVVGVLGGLAELVAVIMIAVGINGDPVNRQAWHDHFAGETRVVKVG